jgi:hypothetical protein
VTQLLLGTMKLHLKLNLLNWKKEFKQLNQKLLNRKDQFLQLQALWSCLKCQRTQW